MCLTGSTPGSPATEPFAEYRSLFPLSWLITCRKACPLIDAAFLEPISLTVRTLDHVKPRLGDTVAIVGPGSIGMFHLQAFKSAGASMIIVIGLDQDAKRFEIAKKLGADHIVNASHEDAVKRVRN